MSEKAGKEIIDRIREAGVVGAGGAGFPTHVKAAARVDTVIANGAECEPLLSCDRELMRQHPVAVLDGLRLLGEATGATTRVLAVKEKNLQALKGLVDSARTYPDVTCRSLGDFYPAGDEVTLVYEVTGRIVPEGGIPPDVGVVVQNVGTLAKIADAVEGKPFDSRIVTVAGEVREPATFEAPLGTSFEDLIRAAGGPSVEPFSIVVGGPCMGSLAAGLDDPLLKTTTGILVLKPDHPLVVLKSANLDQLLHRARSVCDQCRYCTDLCPRYLLGHALEPHRLMTAIGWGNALGAAELRTAHLCCECGICGLYACPMDLYPNLYIHRIKAELLEAGIPRQPGAAPDVPHGGYAFRRLPTTRLKARLGIENYPTHTPWNPKSIRPSRVKLLLKQHVGLPAVPRVERGARVQRGDLIGEIPEGALGARLHASIDGQVVEVSEEWILIESF